MLELKIQFLKSKEIPPDIQAASDLLDRLAFAGIDQDDPEMAKIQWSAHEWMELGFIRNDLVSQLCVLKREIRVGLQTLRIAGIGGVATHPTWQRHGLASQLLRESAVFMRETMAVPFGLLVCAPGTQRVYLESGWQTVARVLTYVQNGQRRSLDQCVMVLPLTAQPWPAGEIDVCGLPW